MSLFPRRRSVPPATDAILVRVEAQTDRLRELLEELREELEAVDEEEGDHGA